MNAASSNNGFSRESVDWRRSIARALAIGLAALALCWPALWNGYPLLFPDSLEYLGTGHGVTMMLRGMATPTWMFVSMRSEIYAASIYLLHVRALLWPIIVVQATLTAWVIWLVVRSLCLRPLTVYLVLIALLCALTGVAWYASYVMPDILGSVPYLSLYLLVFVTESLRHWERAALAGVSCWAVTSHSTYLVVTALLCVLFTLLWLGRWVAMRGRGVGLGRMVGVVLLAAAAQMVVHARLYGRPSLFGNPPPFLMARLLGDGPARLLFAATLLYAALDDLPPCE